MKDTMKLRGLVTLEVTDKKGKSKEKKQIKNTICNLGIKAIVGLAGNVDSQTAFTYLAAGIGTTSANATDTALESEIVDSGLARASATTTSETTTVTDDTLQLVKAWTVSGTKAVTEIGILNASSSGVLLGHQVFSVLNVVSGDTLMVTYQVVLS